MILVTVGTQLPFDRLIKMIDLLAPRSDSEFFAQTGSGDYEPQNIRWSRNVEPDEFDRMLRACSIIISHAGIGTVLKAYRYKKPIIIVPREAKLGEHRNDHQLATVSQLKERQGIYVANDIEGISSLLNQPLQPAMQSDEGTSSKEGIQNFILLQSREAMRKNA